MMKRLAVLVFIFLIGSNVLTGTPISAEKSEQKMECCKHALQLQATVQAAARLCCVINCPQPSAPASVTLGIQFTQFVPLIISLYRSVSPGRAVLPQVSKRLFTDAELFQSYSPPIYLRHSAFLI